MVAKAVAPTSLTWAARPALVAKTRLKPSTAPSASTFAARPSARPTATAPLILRRVPAVVGLIPCKTRLNTAWPPLDAPNDARQRPMAVRAPVTAPAAIITARQVTTRAMRRLLRMEGVATTPKPTAIMGPRRRTRPRQTSRLGVPTSVVVAPSASPFLFAAGQARRTPVVVSTAAVPSGPVAPQSGGP